MAVEAKKEQNAQVETPQLSELELVNAELAQMKKNFNVLNTNFKRAQTKNTQLEAQLDALKAPKAESRKSVAETPVVVSEQTVPSSKNVQEPVNPEEHLVQWVPKFCPECGTANESFKDQVKCKNCGVHLGSERYARHVMKACPNCGSTDFVAENGYTPQHLERNGCTGPECKLE